MKKLLFLMAMIPAMAQADAYIASKKTCDTIPGPFEGVVARAKAISGRIEERKPICKTCSRMVVAIDDVEKTYAVLFEDIHDCRFFLARNRTNEQIFGK